MSSFNNLIHELSVDPDSSGSDDSSGEEDNDGGICPASPSSHCSRMSRSSSARSDRHRSGWIGYVFLWILFPLKLMLWIPSLIFYGGSKSSSNSESHNPTRVPSFKKVQVLKDHFVNRTTDKRRGVVEVYS